MRKLAVVCIAVALTLSGCGKSTSEGSDSSSTTSLATEKSTSTSTSPAAGDRPDTGSTATDTPEDKSTREIERIPDKPPRSPKEEAYLKALSGITTAGVEDQLIVAAQEVCTVGADSAIVGGIAGQLVQLGHAEGDEKAVRERIAQAAKKAYC